ncbi:hypothetical protein DFJ58DRAFT_842449 [Suillus subalutaceus]|uniref:uncharacterized protein n=1 Tax=Suillus subalutaceus TaxID=48586 RepID=UPI001B885CD4|nr:uncharacterized protein DFJ58DRAFT_842449 [Suillus subalutaceus]KAG1850379.1 hypothetical protein DFJ58DRAFT_842449 [Suillus subalutaceus]
MGMLDNKSTRKERFLYCAIDSRAALDIYKPIEEIETHRFLKRCTCNTRPIIVNTFDTPLTGYHSRISLWSRSEESSDPFINIAERALDQFSQSTLPVPSWLILFHSWTRSPNGFLELASSALARELHEMVQKMVSAPYKFAIDEIAAGDPPMSCTSAMLEGHTLRSGRPAVTLWFLMLQEHSGAWCALCTANANQIGRNKALPGVQATCAPKKNTIELTFPNKYSTGIRLTVFVNRICTRLHANCSRTIFDVESGIMSETSIDAKPPLKYRNGVGRA